MRRRKIIEVSAKCHCGNRLKVWDHIKGWVERIIASDSFDPECDGLTIIVEPCPKCKSAAVNVVTGSIVGAISPKRFGKTVQDVRGE